MTYTVTAAQDGMLLRSFLRALHLSTAMQKRIKYTEGGLTVNGAHATVRRVLRAGDTVELLWADREASEKIAPVDLPLPIAYEDDDVVVPDKPANMPTHPSRDHFTDTVANALCFRYRQAGIPFVFRTVNRLDRNTSGLVLVARNQPAAARLGRAMREGRIRKTYAALLCGVPEPREGVIHAPLCRTEESIIVRRVCDPGEGDDAVTCYRTAAVSDDGRFALVLAAPVTGRTHQLRVHFAHVGHPILGDDLYGLPAENARTGFSRQALHAGRLVFPQPVTDRPITVRAPLPQDMAAFLTARFTAFCAEGGPEKLFDTDIHTTTEKNRESLS